MVGDMICNYIFLLFFPYYFFGIFCNFLCLCRPSETCCYHANTAGSPTRNGMSLQVGEMPDLIPGLHILQPCALPLSHHIPLSDIDPWKKNWAVSREQTWKIRASAQLWYFFLYGPTANSVCTVTALVYSVQVRTASSWELTVYSDGSNWVCTV